jgi:hypothetical protein
MGWERRCIPVGMSSMKEGIRMGGPMVKGSNCIIGAGCWSMRGI